MNKLLILACVLLMASCVAVNKAMSDHYVLYYKIKALKVVKVEQRKKYYNYVTVAVSSNRFYYYLADTARYEPGDTIVLKDEQYGRIRFRKYFENQ